MSNPYEMSAAELSALLCARLCHDLVSPVSAIGNALSVLDDPSAHDMHSDAMDLVRGSASQAWAKLEFARLAFGAGGSAPGQLDTRELQRVSDVMYGGGKHELVWKIGPAGLEKTVAKLLLNLVTLGVEALPRGGVVTIEVSAPGDRVRVVSEGRRARLSDAARAALEGTSPEDGFDARSIQPYYAGMLARETGGRASAQVDEERVEVIALSPEKPTDRVAVFG